MWGIISDKKGIFIEHVQYNPDNTITIIAIRTGWTTHCWTLSTYAGGYDLVYFGTLCQRSSVSRGSILRILQRNKDALKFCDINLRPPYYSKEAIENSLEICDVLKLNEDELKVIKEYFHLDRERETALQELSETFKVRTICLTLGSEGSMLYHNGRHYFQNLTKVPVVDTVGAGDVYSSILCLGLLCNWTPEAMIVSCQP